MTPEVESLMREDFDAAATVGRRLESSLEGLSALFPLGADAIGRLEERDVERLDALVLRFTSLVSLLQDRLFRDVAQLEGEDARSLSARDRAELMEKLGALGSAQGFAQLVLLRNRLAHHYPNDPLRQAERLNLLHSLAPEALAALRSLEAHVVRKRLL